jgi:hypothetical protein
LIALVCLVFQGYVLQPLKAQELDASSLDWSLPTGNQTLDLPTNDAQGSAAPNPNSLALPQSPPPAYQKGFQFKNLFKKKEPPIDVDKLMQVGPRQYADTRGALLRLQTAVCLNGITLPAGIYLAQLQHGPNPQVATAIIQQAGRVMASVPLAGQPFATESTTHTAPMASIQDSQLLIQDKAYVWVANFPTCDAFSN